MAHLSFQKWCIQNKRPDLLDEWDAEKNASLGIFPDKIGCRSSKVKVWWQCSLGHSYDAYISNRTKRNDA